MRPTTELGRDALASALYGALPTALGLTTVRFFLGREALIDAFTILGGAGIAGMLVFAWRGEGQDEKTDEEGK